MQYIIIIKLLMESILPGQRVQYRKRYNSMQLYNEYKKNTGLSPKIPDPPSFKPEIDPFDVPPFDLEDQLKQMVPITKKSRKKIEYRMEPILEIEGSQNNSITFQQPQKCGKKWIDKPTNTLQYEGKQVQSIQPGKRQRYRQRSYSQNCHLQTRFKIIDFLTQSKQEAKPRKQIKLT